VAVQFVAASYAGVLTVTVVADPVHLPDLQALVAALQRELGRAHEEATAMPTDQRFPCEDSRLVQRQSPIPSTMPP
jgi:hypothetical protein